MVRGLLCLTFFFSFFSFISAQLNTVLESSVNYSNDLNDVWGYSAGGKEYALVGRRNGVNIQDVTDPANPIDKGSTLGATSTWRDIKTFGSYAYVTNENSGGIQIIDLSNLPNSITASDYSNWAPNISGLGNLSSCHNIYIDGNGYGYLAGCNLNAGGILYIDLFTNPGSPAYVDKGPFNYAHDVFVESDIMYTSDLGDGLNIFNVADKTNTVFVGNASTPNNFCHNAWPNATGTVVFTTDEKSNAYTAAYDISTPSAPVELDRFRPLGSVGTGVIPHNVHVAGDFLVISHYSDGVVIVDASTPDNMIEVGNYDTWTSSGTGFNGAWGAYPYLPSGNILVTDQDNGLFIINPTYVYAAKLVGTITDFSTGNNVVNATVTIAATQANSAVTDFFGEYKTGIADAGTYNVTVSKVGYTDVTFSTTLTNGVTQTFDVMLGAPLPLDLLSFSVGKSNEQDALLTWEATQTDGPFEFEIQHAINGQDFRTIGTIVEEGTPGLSQTFSYLHEAPGRGNHYYRLKMIEADRSFNFSNVEELSLNSVAQVQVYPNPMNKEISFLTIEGEFSARKEYIVNIISPIGGQTRFPMSGAKLQTIAKDKFTPGVNYIEILENGQSIFQTQVLIY